MMKGAEHPRAWSAGARAGRHNRLWHERSGGIIAAHAGAWRRLRRVIMLGLLLALCAIPPVLARQGGSDATAAGPATTPALPIDLKPAMGDGAAPSSPSAATPAARPETPPPAAGKDGASAESLADEPAAAAPMPDAAQGGDLPISLQPAMPAADHPSADPQEAAKKPPAPAARATQGQRHGAPQGAPAPATAEPTQTENASAEPAKTAPAAPPPPPPPALPEESHARTTTAASPSGPTSIPSGMDARFGGNAPPLLIVNVVPHFLIAGALAGLVLALALLLALVAVFGRTSLQAPGGWLFSCGAFLLIVAHTGILSALPPLAAWPSLPLRLATLGEALMSFGAGWWLIGWLGVPQARMGRLLLMALAGLMLSVLMLAPFYPAALAPLTRHAFIVIALAGYLALLFPHPGEPRHGLGHLVLAALFAWGVFETLVALGVLSLSSASMVLYMSAAVAALAVLLALAALTDGSRAAAGADLSLVLAGADVLPFRYDPATARLQLPAALSRRLHLPAGVTQTLEGFLAVVHPEDQPLLEALLRATSLDEPVDLPLRLADGEGAWRTFALRVRTIRPRRHSPPLIAGLLMEIDDHLRAAPAEPVSTAQEAMLHDPLTGLPGQLLLLDRLETALARARKGRGLPCLVVLDVDRFRGIVDALGLAAGDLLIIELARRLQLLIGEGETLARLPSDQFALIIDAEQHGTPLSFVQRLRETLNEPFDIDGEEVSLSVSIGVVDLVAAMALTPREVLRAAEIALFEARRDGPGHEAFYTPDMHGEHARLAKLEQELRRALKLGELEVHYQPIIWLQQRWLAGFEALVRWRHPDKGLIGPEAFIGLAEEIGIVREIGHLVLRESIRQLAIWQRTFRTETPFFISVNVASTDLLDPDLADEVSELLARENADPAGLKLEVTESLLLRDPARARATLERLVAAGVGVVCDDFGTGYSSLSRLRSLPFDALKIDRSFLSSGDPASQSIVAAVVDLAHGLSMRVVAEGVEEPWQIELLETLGCDMVQGYLLAPALNAAVIQQYMAQARKLAPFTGRLAALSHILLREEVAPPLPQDIERPPMPAAGPAPSPAREQERSGDAQPPSLSEAPQGPRPPSSGEESDSARKQRETLSGEERATEEDESTASSGRPAAE